MPKQQQQQPQLRNPLLHYPHLRYPNPYFTVIHNRINVKIVLHRITLPIVAIVATYMWLLKSFVVRFTIKHYYYYYYI